MSVWTHPNLTVGLALASAPGSSVGVGSTAVEMLRFDDRSPLGSEGESWLTAKANPFDLVDDASTLAGELPSLITGSLDRAGVSGRLDEIESKPSSRADHGRYPLFLCAVDARPPGLCARPDEDLVWPRGFAG